MAALAAAWPALLAAGTAVGAVGQIQQGRSAKKMADFEASQMTAAAGMEKARSQRAAMETVRQGKLLESKAEAAGAASGAGGYARHIGDIAAETEYRKAIALYGGDVSARNLMIGAQQRRLEGKLAKRAGYMGAISTALMGAGSIGSRFPQMQRTPMTEDYSYRAFSGGIPYARRREDLW